MIVVYGTHVYNDNISRLFFHFFKVLISRVVSGGRGLKWQKMVQNDKKLCLSPSIFQESNIWLVPNHMCPWCTYDCAFMVPMCKMIISSGVLLILLRILIFGINRGWMGKKWPSMRKNPVFLSHSVSQEPYIIWLRFLVYMGKMMTSPAIFIIFSKFWFFGF